MFLKAIKVNLTVMAKRFAHDTQLSRIKGEIYCGECHHVIPIEDQSQLELRSKKIIRCKDCRATHQAISEADL